MKRTFSLFILLIFTSCFFSGSTKIIGNYYVGKVGDSKVNWLIYGDINCCGEGIIGGVNEIGVDDNYIIIDSGLQEYYIIPYTKNKKTYFDKKILIGPLNEDEFNTEKKKLNIEQLDFSFSF